MTSFNPGLRKRVSGKAVRRKQPVLKDLAISQEGRRKTLKRPRDWRKTSVSEKLKGAAKLFRMCGHEAAREEGGWPSTRAKSSTCQGHEVEFHPEGNG